MDAVSLFDLASLQARWLSARQSSVAGNIANVNTPGYRARDVAPFSELLERQAGQMARTSVRHFGADGVAIQTAERGGTGEVTFEGELAKSSDIRAGYELNAAIVRAFHRMALQVART